MARKRAAKDEPAPPTGPEMTPEERAALDGRLAKMLTKPHKSGDNDNYFLLWTQRDENDSPTVMMWHPETPEELRGAAYFHDAAHGLGEFAKTVAKGKRFRRSAEETALINAIIHDRDDETAYLVYADYLTEKGDTQGDFVRLCVELEHLKPGEPEYDTKYTRQQELIDAHGEDWYAALGKLGPRPEFYGRFVPWLWLSIARGVIEEVVIDRPVLLPERADRLFAAAPFLRKLEFEKGQVDPSLAKVKQLAQIEELEFSHADLTAEVLSKILKSKHLTRLKTLLLNGNEIGHAGVHELAVWPGLTRLEALDLTSCSIGPEGVTELAACKNTTNLVRLRIGSNAIDSDAVRAVLSSPHLKKLTELELSGSELDPIVAAEFRRAAFAKSLQRLDLESANLQPGALAELTRCAMPGLQSLNLNSVPLRGTAPASLANAVFAGTLTALSLDNCELGAVGIEEFCEGKFPKLTALDLSRNRLANRGGIALANAAKNFPAITSLKLWDNKLGPDAITALANSKLLANVTELDLNGNKIGPTGAIAIAKSKHLKNLKSFTVDEKTVGQKGKQALSDRFGEDVVSWREY